MSKARADAWKLLQEWVKNQNLIKHLLSVEAAMQAYAKKFGEDEEMWAIAGLLHDFDYEKFPSLEQHPVEGNKILKELDYPDDITDAIMGHAPHTGMARNSQMAKALFACDELCGMIMAVAYVRPNKLEGMKPKSVKKKLKDKSFAANVNREEVEQGITELGVERDEHIQTCIQAMQSISKELGF